MKEEKIPKLLRKKFKETQKEIKRQKKTRIRRTKKERTRRT